MMRPQDSHPCLEALILRDREAIVSKDEGVLTSAYSPPFGSTANTERIQSACMESSRGISTRVV
jgi:hypothetical protein